MKAKVENWTLNIFCCLFRVKMGNQQEHHFDQKYHTFQGPISKRLHPL